MPEYDRWYREVLDEKKKCFYPNRIPLLENLGAPMFLFHVHHHAVLGEAKILEATEKEGKHFYCFEEFISYSNPVQLELIQTDLRLPKLAMKGRWRWINIREETINEIRRLSELPEQKRKELGKDLERVINQLNKYPFPKIRRPSWEVYMRNECEKLRRNYGLNEQILAKTQEYFAKAIKMKLSVGRSHVKLFYASLYLAFRMLKIPKLFSDISRISDVKPTKLRKLYCLLASKFKLTVPPIDPKQLIRFRSDKIDVSKNTIEKAIALVEEAQNRRITEGRAPPSVAAAAIFIVCRKEGKNIRPSQIAKVFDVSTTTIRNYSRELERL